MEHLQLVLTFGVKLGMVLVVFFHQLRDVGFIEDDTRDLLHDEGFEIFTADFFVMAD
ncbi:MAG: hypothetical protein IJA85_08610 [Clostridia bacterium]|nr:hypothetical protein [Clostridia bacterium]